MKYSLSNIVVFVLLFLFACNTANETEYTAVSMDLSQQEVILIDSTKLKITAINFDSLIVITPGENGVPLPKKVKVGKPTVKPNRLAPILAGKPTVTEIDTTKLMKVTPGQNNIPLPKTYLLPDTGFLLQHGDTIYAPKTILAKHPRLTPALAPRYKDVANYNIQYLDTDQGMPSSYVYSILEDKSGNIWFGTYGGGVSRYDGKSFITFTDKEGLSNNSIRSVLEDKNGNLWFGTNGGGVSRYDGKSFTNFTNKEGLSNNSVRSILEDKSGNIWFGTRGGGVSRYDGKSFTSFTDKEGLSNNFILSIIEDKSGNIWFGTNGGGVSRYDGKSFTNFTDKDGLANNKVISIFEDKTGNIWFGTYRGGVSRYDGKSFTNFTEKEGLSSNRVYSIIEDKSGNIWFGTLGGGVSRYDGEFFTNFTVKEGLSNNSVRSIIVDKSGSLWFGTRGGGVNRYDGKSFTNFTDKEGLSSNIVLSILEDTSGNLWFGIRGGGVSRYDGKSFISFTKEQGLGHNTVRSIIEDKNGNLWFGTNGGGVSRYDGKFFTTFTNKEGLGANLVYSILEDTSGNLWFGTYGGGVSRYDGKSFTTFTNKEGLANNSVRSILEDTSGNLWFGTNGGGLSRYDGKSFTNFTDKEGLSHNSIRSSIADKNGNLWFATRGGGVSLLQKDASKISSEMSFQTINTTHGLSHDLVLSFIQDSNNRLWVGTEGGITLLSNFKKKTGQTEFDLYKFSKLDGLKGPDVVNNSAYIDSRNQAWWGMGKGLSMLDLNTFELSTKTPTIQLNTIDIKNTFVDYHQLQDSLQNENLSKSSSFREVQFTDVPAFQNYPISLELSYELNHLTFHFSAIDWAAPHKIQYQYKLEGLNNTWSQLSKENKAEYRNIPHGNFTFKVKAIGAANKWSEIFEYKFTVHPPWWLTWWAYVLYALTTILFVFLFVQWRTSKLKQHQKELEQTVEERTYQLKVSNEELNQNNEELNATLKLIYTQTAKIVKQKHEIEDKNEELNKINEELNIMLDLVSVQKMEIEHSHKHITASINYAKRIQTAVLPSEKLRNEILPEHFILFKPRDIVSGDFYWMKKVDNYLFIAIADCTGHGVPGAFMSMLGISYLNEIIRNKEIKQASQVLNELRNRIKETLDQTGKRGESKDGIDMAFYVIDTNTNKLQFSGAYNPLYIFRNKELIMYKANRQPIGIYIKEKPFSNHEIQLETGDTIYAFSDGYVDQFGGENGRKYLAKQFRETLTSIQSMNMKEQKQLLEQKLADWKGESKQIDDILVFGVKVSSWT